MAEKPTLSIAPVPAPEERHAASMTAVRRALEELRFGQIVITVHEGKVVQLDVTEKIRFNGG